MIQKFKIFSFVLLLILSINILAFSGDSLDVKLIKARSDSERVDLYNETGFNIRQNSPGKAIEYLRKAMTISDSIDYKNGLIQSNIFMGIINKNTGSFDKAIDFFISALRIAEKTEDKAQISICLNNIGNIYQTQKNFDKALKYYLESLKIEDTLENKPQLSIRYYNIGTIYELTGNYDKAYSYYYNSLIIEQDLDNKEGMYYALAGIAGVDLQKKNFAAGFENISKALAIASEINDAIGMAICYNEYGKYYSALYDQKNAIIFFKKGIQYADSVRYSALLKEIYYEISEAYKVLNDYPNAFLYLDKYTVLNDSINSLEIRTKISELSAKYEIEKKEQEIEFLEQQQKMASLKAKTERKNRYFLIITFILAIALALSNLGRVIEGIKKIIQYTLLVILFLLSLTVIIYFSVYNGDDWNLSEIFILFIDVLTYSILPVFIFVLIAERVLLSKRLNTARNLSEQLREIEKPYREGEVTLLAGNEKTSLTVRLYDLLYIEGNDNYTNIYYMAEEKVTRAVFRTSMKNLEMQLADQKEVIRCHKSYIVNLLNINKITGNAQGYKLILSKTDFAVPVSRNFSKEILGKLKALKTEG